MAVGGVPLSILAVNAGSSTLKAALFDDAASRELAASLVDREPDDGALEEALAGIRAKAPDEAARIRAVGHRVVHGGVELRESARIDARVREAIARLADLAPLHNTHALRAIAAAERRFPGIPHVAAFDTAFFADLPPRAFLYPVPYAWYTSWGIRRFGFHGLSHAYCASRAAEMLAGHGAPLRLVILHLGNGCSGSAVVDGTPVTTTMGFTPMEGLMMGTRSGSIDPGIPLYAQRLGMDAAALDYALNQESGLLGVSGVSGDLREVEAAARAGNDRARLAITMFADRARAAVGALAVAMGGVDALVFTGGIGENAAALREEISTGLECLGLVIDKARNADARADQDVAARSSSGRILVIETREDLVVARETLRVCGDERVATAKDARTGPGAG